MIYQLTIVRREENPNFADEMKERRERFAYAQPMDLPQRYLDSKTLEVELSEEEFKDFKAAALKQFS